MALVNTTVTTTTSTSTQQGTQMVVGTQSNTVSIGNYVTDVTLQPYMASQVISFFAYNMRPNIPVHIFFDSVNVDQYCAPATVPTYQSTGTYYIADSSNYQSLARSGSWGAQIYSDANGLVAGQFNIPASTFKTGDRVLEIADVTNLAQGNNSITTSAMATFTASNMSVTKQNVTMTTVNPVISYVPVTNTVVTVNTSTSVTINNTPIINTSIAFDPLAQSLMINTPNGEVGLYATSLQLYFNQVPMISNNGISVYLVQTLNGYPDGSVVLPFSKVHLPRSAVNVSTDSSAATTFIFEAPVYLASNTEYAFIVEPDNSDPDYRIYTATLGNVDLLTGTQVYSQPTIGTAFYGATSMQWTALQTEYVKFVLNIANFTAGVGVATFNNDSTDYIAVNGVGITNTSTSILPGDLVFSSVNTNIANLVVNSAVTGYVRYYDSVKGTLYVANSTGNFVCNTTSQLQIHRYPNTSYVTPNTTSYIGYANSNAFVSPVIDALVGQFATITPSGTSLSFNYKGASNTYVMDQSNNNLNVGSVSQYTDEERIVASKSTEVVSMGGGKSMNVSAQLTTSSQLLSPLIDTVKTGQLAIKNMVSNTGFYYSEFMDGGTCASKYISQVVTLSAGQPASSLSLTVAMYRPPGTDVQAYYRVLNGQDPGVISSKTWAPMLNQTPNFYSSPSNFGAMTDVTFLPASAYVAIPTTGYIWANSVNGSNVVGFNSTFTTDLKVGYYINMPANPGTPEYTRQVVSITNNTFMTLNASFVNNWANSIYYLVPPPSTPFSTQFSSTQVSGTVTTSTTNNSIIGVGTAFNTQFSPGSVIAVAGNEEVVVSVTNSTFLTVGTPWTSAVTGANVYIQTMAGMNYLDANNNLYTGFTQFQVKLLFTANSSASVPMVDNLRVIALS